MATLNERVDKINSSEYPPKYIGIKHDQTTKSVYRKDGNLGLIFEFNGHKEIGIYYVWKHFIEIKDR